ncbi:MAG: HAD hydrolase family protein [Buchnera aphidicola (Eriosoma harunire)]
MVVHYDISKVTVLKFISSKICCTLDNYITFGDNMNDYDMYLSQVKDVL